MPELLVSKGYELRAIPQHIGAVIGTAVHHGVSTMLERKMVTGELTPPAEARDAALASLDEQIKAMYVTWDQESPEVNTAARQVDRMLARYRVDVGFDAVPVAIEKRLEVTLQPGVILSGQVDQITIYPGHLRDVKTGKRRAWNTPQYGCYSAIGRAHGYDIATIIEDYIPRVSVRAEQPPVQQIEIDRRHAEKVAKHTVKEAVRQIQEFDQTGDPIAFPANPSSALCRDTFCPAWGTKFCKEWILP